MLYRRETLPIKEEYAIRLERNERRMAKWMFNVRSEDRISAEELSIRLKSKSMRECLQDRRLQLFEIVI